MYSVVLIKTFDVKTAYATNYRIHQSIKVFNLPKDVNSKALADHRATTCE